MNIFQLKVVVALVYICIQRRHMHITIHTYAQHKTYFHIAPDIRSYTPNGYIQHPSNSGHRTESQDPATQQQTVADRYMKYHTEVH